MYKIHVFILLVFVSVLAYSFFTDQTKTQDVLITAQGFSPKLLYLKEGDKVHFVNNDTVAHWPASNTHPTHDVYPEFDPKRELQPKESWSFTFPKAGSWFFHDHLNPEFGGKVVVSIRQKKVVKSQKFISKIEGKRIMNEMEKLPSSQLRRAMKDLTYKVGPEVAVELLNESKLPRYCETHLAAHSIGEVAYDLYGTAGLEHCFADTLNGCSHGIVMAGIVDLGFEGVKEMLQNCKKSTAFKYESCNHALGHSLLAYYDYDIMAALPKCEELAESDAQNRYVGHCLNGLFMENTLGNHDGRGPSDHPWLSKTNLQFPCDTVEEKYKGPCYSSLPEWWIQLYRGDIYKMTTACNEMPEAYRVTCADGAGRMISTLVNNQVDRIVESCGYLEAPYSDHCLQAISRSSFILNEPELPYAMCREIVDQPIKKYCYEYLVSLFQRYNLNPSERNERCAKFEPLYQYLCQS